MRSNILPHALSLALPLAIAAPAFAAGEGKDFSAEVKLLYRVAACAGDEPIPANLDKPTIDAYCERLGKSMEQHKKMYVEGAQKFISEHRPAGLPSTVVYPFGGGDLLMALTTYPDAKEITTISLEHAGDPRRLNAGLKKDRLNASLRVIRSMGGGLLVWNDSKSETLSAAQRNDLPGEVALFLIALAVNDYEPISLRYFRLEPDGTMHYYDEEEIAAVEKNMADKLKSNWVPPDFSEAFSNSEIKYRKRGSGSNGEIRIHRHIAANLHDDNLGKDPALIKHLEKKGRVSAMTKAASYLLWYDGFSKIRNYLLANMDFMISDSTGIPPPFAEKAGFVQVPFGTFEGSFLNANPGYNKAFRKLWESSPKKPLPFRYGYLDSSKKFHMLITKPAPKTN